MSALSRLELYPQYQQSFKTLQSQIILDSNELKSKVKEFEEYLGEDGRILIRKSGTEPKLRLLVEAKNKRKAKKVFSSLSKLIENMC